MKRRVIKTAAERKTELAECALALFLSKGYEATTVVDVLARTRLSKGAFYHHFRSKEDLLEAAMARLVSLGIAAMRDIVDNEELDEITRLKRLLIRMTEWQHEMNVDAINVDMLKPENAPLALRISSAMDKVMVPFFTGIIERGARKGEFDVPDPEVAAEVLLFVGTARRSVAAEAIKMAAHGQIEEATKLAEQHFVAREIMMERALGVPRGSIELATAAALRTQLAAYGEAARKAKSRKK